MKTTSHKKLFELGQYILKNYNIKKRHEFVKLVDDITFYLGSGNYFEIRTKEVGVNYGNSTIVITFNTIDPNDFKLNSFLKTISARLSSEVDKIASEGKQKKIEALQQEIEAINSPAPMIKNKDSARKWISGFLGKKIYVD